MMAEKRPNTEKTRNLIFLARKPLNVLKIPECSKGCSPSLLPQTMKTSHCGSSCFYPSTSLLFIFSKKIYTIFYESKY